MATRLYFYRSSTFSPSPNSFTPVYNSLSFTWDYDFSVTYPMDIHGGALSDDASFLTRTVTTNSSAGTVCHAIGVTRPMAGSYTWDNTQFLDFNIRISEALSTQNCYTNWAFGILNNDGTVAWATNGMKDNTEAGTSLCARINNAGYTPSPASYTSVPGDRIYVEVGWDKDGAVSGDISMQYGKVGTTDLGTGTDCNANNPYIEISNTVTFDAEGTVYGSSKQLMTMGCGS